MVVPSRQLAWILRELFVTARLGDIVPTDLIEGDDSVRGLSAQGKVGRVKVVLIHNIVSPYRVSLFDAMSNALKGEFAVLFARETHPQRRSWAVPKELNFSHEFLTTFGIDWDVGAVDLSWGTASQLERIDPDVVVVTGLDMNASWAAKWWAMRRKRVVVGWSESWQESSRLSGPVARSFRRAFFSGLSGVVVPGYRGLAWVRRQGYTGPVARIGNPVPGAEFRSLPRPSKEARGALFVGELSRRKGIDLLLAATPELRELYSHLIVIGSGPLESEVKRAAASDGRFLNYKGFLDHASIASCMSNCSTLLLPSRKDAWGMVAVEALVARRKLVLGPGVGAAPDLEEVAPDGVAVMDEPTAESLVRSASRVQSRRGVPEEVRDAFTPNATAERFLAFIEVLRP